MSVDNATVTRRDDGGWAFTWPVGTPPYAIWLDGLLIATVLIPSFQCKQPGYENVPPDLEILNAGDVSQSKLYPPYLLLQWRGVQGAAGYLIEKYTGTDWVTAGSIQETRRGYYSWKSPPQADHDDVQYRVSAVDLAGNTGNPIVFQVQVCCNPRHPSVAVTVSNTGDIVVSGV